MATLTMGDVGSYFTAFQAEYGYPFSVGSEEDNLDAIEEAFDKTDDDDLDQILPAMLAVMESKHPSKGDRSTPEPEAPPVNIVKGSAWDYAQKLNDAQFQNDLETNALAALENKRGAAVIARDLVRIFGRDVIATVWPIPGSSVKTHGLPSSQSRQLHKYPKIVKDADGMDKPGEGDWYYDIWDGSVGGKLLIAQLDSIKAVKAGEKGKHITAEHAKLFGDDVKIVAEKAMLDGMRNNKKAAIVRATNLIQRIHRVNTETTAIARIITEDGATDGVPVKSNKLLFIKDGKDETKFVIKTIGQFLSYDIDKCKANGGTYSALLSTTGKKPKKGKDVQNVTVDTPKKVDDVIAATAGYFVKLRDDAKAMNAFLTHLNEKGSDDLLLSLNSVMTDIDTYLSKPGIAKRLTDLLASGDGSKRTALAEQFAKGVGKVA